MKNLIHKILKEEFKEDYSWVEDVQAPLVIVTDTSEVRTTHLNAMAELGLDGAKELIDELDGVPWFESEMFLRFSKNYNFYRRKTDVFSTFFIMHLPNYAIPKNGDICYLLNTKNFKEYGNISLLSNIDNNSQFIIGEDGYEPYEE